MPKLPTRESPFSTWRFVLPFPPSVNSYWRRQGHTYFISKAGNKFREAVAGRPAGKRRLAIPGIVKCRPNSRRRLAVTIKLQRGDNIEYDIDNFAKGVFDALAHAGVYQNDSQIDEEHKYRLPPVKGQGCCFVEVKEIGYARTSFKAN